MKKLITFLLCTSCLCLLIFSSACTPKKFGDSCEKLTELGYFVSSYKPTTYELSSLGIDPKGNVYIMMAGKSNAITSRNIYIFNFEKRSGARSMYKEYKNGAENLVGPNGVVKKKGKLVIIAVISAYEDLNS